MNNRRRTKPTEFKIYLCLVGDQNDYYILVYSRLGELHKKGKWIQVTSYSSSVFWTSEHELQVTATYELHYHIQVTYYNKHFN